MSSTPRAKIIVQKYGGATVSEPEKIKQVAQRIATLASSGTQVVAAVSAMGQTTNQLIQLAHKVSSHPSRRELDMLLTTGERVTMALLSMALQDLGCPAISFTGSQAGILTNRSHFNAHIVDVRALRVLEALKSGQVVVLAGFQGVSPETKEITTLGRGGTDTTAVAMAAYLGAECCEILKDVPGVFSADPKLVPTATLIPELNYLQLCEMTFWGAKVLHYRSVELARQKKVKLYIGLANAHGLTSGSANSSNGTRVEENVVFETEKILGLNSFEKIIILEIPNANSEKSLGILKALFERSEIAFPQILSMTTQGSSQQVVLTGPQEILGAIQLELKNAKEVRIVRDDLCSITATCTGVAGSETLSKIMNELGKIKIYPDYSFVSAMSVHVLIPAAERERALNSLHQLI